MSVWFCPNCHQAYGPDLNCPTCGGAGIHQSLSSVPDTVYGRKDYNLIGTEEDPIPLNEPRFVLRAQDEIAELVVRFYALLAERLLHNPRLAESARAQADLFAVWPTRKKPDL